MDRLAFSAPIRELPNPAGQLAGGIWRYLAEAVDDRGVSGLPTGTVTMLFSDMEGSTSLLSRLGDRYGGGAGQRSGRCCGRPGRRCGGDEMGTEGDSFFVVFSAAADAVAAAVEAQRVAGRTRLAGR